MDTAWRIEQLAHCFAKPVLISLIILGFAFHWHLGIAALALAFFGGFLFLKRHAYAHWGEGWCRHGTRWGPGWSSEGGSRENGNGCGGNGSRRRRGGRSGNRAFDEYREETLRRLEEEQKEFEGFLERLRIAKDKAEFDAFLAERRRAAPGPSGSPPETPSQS
jgi:hypothetical protein